MSETLKPYLARSAGIHGALIAAAAFYVPGALKKADKVYMIDFVGGPAVIQSAGPAIAVPAAAAMPDAAPAKPEQQAEKDSFATKGGRVALPRPSLLKGWIDRKAATKPSLLPPTETAMKGVSGPAAGMPGDAAGIATDLPNFPYPWYISQVRQMLWSAWQKRMPMSSGESVVVFSIVRTGAFVDLRMESSSGDAEFDEAALESVQAAAPFPALPSDFGEPFLKIHLTLKSEASWR